MASSTITLGRQKVKDDRNFLLLKPSPNLGLLFALSVISKHLTLHVFFALTVVLVESHFTESE